jgi:hypothetical protein
MTLIRFHLLKYIYPIIINPNPNPTDLCFIFGVLFAQPSSINCSDTLYGSNTHEMASNFIHLIKIAFISSSKMAQSARFFCLQLLLLVIVLSTNFSFANAREGNFNFNFILKFILLQRVPPPFVPLHRRKGWPPARRRADVPWAVCATRVGFAVPWARQSPRALV